MAPEYGHESNNKMRKTKGRKSEIRRKRRRPKKKDRNSEEK
jgi:hypothetical protein